MASVLIRRLDILYQRMREAGALLVEFDLGSQEKLRLSFKREGAKAKEISSQAVFTPAAGLLVAAPLSGIFYRSTSPSSPAFVEVGSWVNAGDVLCIIEAMKVMNEIKAPRPGRVDQILGVNGKHIKKGDMIFTLGER